MSRWRKGQQANPGRPFQPGNKSGRLWKPGESGNPSGVPKGEPELRALAREYTAESLEKMVEFMRRAYDRHAAGERGCEREGQLFLAAVDMLWDRGHGKPAQKVNVAGELEKVGEDELRQLMLEALAIEGVLPRGGTVQ